MDKDSVAIALILIGLVFLPIGLGLHFAFVGHAAGAYEINKARALIDRAGSTTDLQEQNEYLIATLEQLKNFQGNPVWYFPTKETDYDAIKGNIQSMANKNTELSLLNATSYAYQRLVENNLRTYPQINGQLGVIIEWTVTWTPFNVITVVLFIVAWIVVALIAIARA